MAINMIIRITNFFQICILLFETANENMIHMKPHYYPSDLIKKFKWQLIINILLGPFYQVNTLQTTHSTLEKKIFASLERKYRLVFLLHIIED
jgi:hypothetical protein